MTEYFNRDGHISDAGFSALISGGADELKRLELAEHLSFCDDCVLRYSQLLCEDTLITPPHPITESILKRVKNRVRVLFFNRYVTAAAAACIAMVLWVTGVLGMQSIPTENDRFSLVNSAQKITQSTVKFSESVSDSVSKIFRSIENFDWKEVLKNEKK